MCILRAQSPISFCHRGGPNRRLWTTFVEGRSCCGRSVLYVIFHRWKFLPFSRFQLKCKYFLPYNSIKLTDFRSNINIFLLSLKMWIVFHYWKKNNLNVSGSIFFVFQFPPKLFFMLCERKPWLLQITCYRSKLFFINSITLSLTFCPLCSACRCTGGKRFSSSLLGYFTAGDLLLKDSFSPVGFSWEGLHKYKKKRKLFMLLDGPHGSGRSWYGVVKHPTVR